MAALRGGKGETMRKFILGLIVATSCTIAGGSVVSAASFNPGIADGTAQAGTLIHKVASDYCTYLRYKCNNKGRLGESGEGNCRRYRNECQQISYCERLRRACVYKEERGQEGQGNCRRYRNNCGGGRDW
jgi:hypothetical protein